nr:hypothetical protein CFP56_44081 [Quercus suber]
MQSSSNRSGIGIVVRDHEGLVIASLAQNVTQAYKPVEIEAIAAARAIEFAAEIGVDRVVLEGDSSVVTEALRSKKAVAPMGSFHQRKLSKKIKY